MHCKTHISRNLACISSTASSRCSCSSCSSPVLPVPGAAPQQVRRQPRAAARLSAGVVQSRRRGIDLGARRVGWRGARGASARSPSCARAIPKLRVFLSTTTLSGSSSRAAACRTSTRCSISRSTGRSPPAARSNVVKPRLFVMVETEIWPNLLRECRRRGIKTVLVNGRISYRSFPRYRLVRPFIRRVLADIDRFCVQGEETARRLRQLGADPARITVTGSLKFDSLDRRRRRAAAASACCGSSAFRRAAWCSSPAARRKARRSR